jgi:hypothetical protein
MSIYPEGMKADGLMYKFEIAALDVPVPDDLTDRADAQEWHSYCDCLSPAQRLRKFGQALDAFHGLMAKTAEPLTLPEAEQIVLYSKWKAASILNAVLSQNVNFDTKETYRGDLIKSDIDRGLYCVTDLLRSVNSSEAKLWEDRRARHNALTDTDEKHRKFLGLLNKFSNWSGRNTPKAAPPSP